MRDNLQSPSAFVAALDDETLLPVVVAGNRAMLEQDGLTEALDHVNGDVRHEFQWGNYWVLPLYSRRRPEMDRDELPPLLGLLGVARNDQKDTNGIWRKSLWLLADRAALALEDRQLQQRVFRSLADIQPQVEMIQRMRAASRYDTNANLLNAPIPHEADLANWVKDALNSLLGWTQIYQ